MAIPTELGSVVVAIGALGTAAFGLVDAAKIGRSGGISNTGFGYIRDAVRQLLPGASRNASSAEGTARGNLLDVLHGNWINGRPLADQKTIAKSLIKLQLTSATAGDFAAATGVDGGALSGVAQSMTSGEGLTSAQANVLGRFDLALTALLDGGYQRADQRYRNASKFLAMIFAVLLALLGGWSLSPPDAFFLGSADMWRVVLAGLLATPLAPMTKDLASALQAGVKAAQAVKA
jgi:hypothetical protein